MASESQVPSTTISAWLSVSFSFYLYLSLAFWFSGSDGLFQGMLAPVSGQHGKNHVDVPVMALAEAPADNRQHLTCEGPSFQMFLANRLPASLADVQWSRDELSLPRPVQMPDLGAT